MLCMHTSVHEVNLRQDQHAEGSVWHQKTRDDVKANLQASRRPVIKAGSVRPGAGMWLCTANAQDYLVQCFKEVSLDSASLTAKSA